MLTEGIRTTDRPAEFQPATVFPLDMSGGREGFYPNRVRTVAPVRALSLLGWRAAHEIQTEPGTSSRSDNAGIPATADPARVSCLCSCPTSVCVPDEELRQLFRAAERDAVAGQDLVWRDVQALGD